MKTTSIYTLFFSPTGTSRRIAAAVAQGMAGTKGRATRASAGDNTAPEPPAGQTPEAGTAAAAPEPAAGNRGETASVHGAPAVTAIDLPRRTTRSAAGWGRRHIRRAGLRKARGTRSPGTPAGDPRRRHSGHRPGRLRQPLVRHGRRRARLVRRGAGIRARSGRGSGAATAFGAQVREKLAKTGSSPGRNPETASDTAATTRTTQTDSMDAAKAPATGALVPIDPAKLREPRTPLLPKLRFIRFVLGYRRRQKRNPVVLLPEGDAARCTQCGRCVALCPTQAIARGDELHTDPARCIRCCACVKGCAFGARTFRTPFAAALARNFARRKPPVTLL